MSGLRLPASASCLGRHSHLAGRGPNSNSLLPPLAAVVAVALCRQAPGRAVRHREDLLLQKSSFSGSCLIHSMEWFSELVREHDHLQCRQHLIAAEAASTAYHKIIRFATKTPPASHLCAAPGACFFCGESSPQCQLAQNTALKFGRHLTGFFQTIYLKIVLSVVLSL